MTTGKYQTPQGEKEMRNPKYPLLAIGAYLALVGVLAISSPGTATGQKGGPPGPDVRVVNKTTEPVPVTLQGSAQIDTSSPIPVRDVDRVAQQPIQFEIAHNNGVDFKYTVPAGKRLVIEHVSGGANVQSGVMSSVSVETQMNGDNAIRHRFVLSFIGQTGSAMFYGVTQPAHLYADPGTEVVVIPNHPPSATGPFVNLAISGYLVDAP
jgi:hypothetical protein